MTDCRILYSINTTISPILSSSVDIKKIVGTFKNILRRRGLAEVVLWRVPDDLTGFQLRRSVGERARELYLPDVLVCSTSENPL